MELNQATMREAVQLWVDSQFAEGKAPVVWRGEDGKNDRLWCRALLGQPVE